MRKTSRTKEKHDPLDTKRVQNVQMFCIMNVLYHFKCQHISQPILFRRVGNVFIYNVVMKNIRKEKYLFEIKLFVNSFEESTFKKKYCLLNSRQKYKIQL